MIALHQNVANCQNTLTVLTLRWRIFPQDIDDHQHTQKYEQLPKQESIESTQIVREETPCRQMGYSFRLAARVLLYASSHRQDNTYHCLCYTSCGALAGMRSSSMGPP